MSKILVVESDPDVSCAARDWLLLQGYTVDTAADGKEALELLVQQDYDVILLDAHITKVSGLELCKRYRDNGGCARILMYSTQDSCC